MSTTAAMNTTVTAPLRSRSDLCTVGTHDSLCGDSLYALGLDREVPERAASQRGRGDGGRADERSAWRAANGRRLDAAGDEAAQGFFARGGV